MDYRKIIGKILAGCTVAAMACACSDFMDPLPNGTYNGDNHDDYPGLIRGYIDHGYNMLPSSYYVTEFIGTDAVTDDAVYREEAKAMRQYSLGAPRPDSNPFSSMWNRDYRGIFYTNLFLENDLGINTRYLVDEHRDSLYRRCLQGDAYALRAWFYHDLLKVYGGRTADGALMGVPVLTRTFDLDEIDAASLVREDYDTCIKRILDDCDSALVYLPLANRDFLIENGESNQIVGGIRYRKFDRVAVTALKALTYLMWASPAYNPDGDKSRWLHAAECAAEVMRHKLEKENVPSGFDPAKSFSWMEPNSPEAVMISDAATTTTYELHFYPQGFNGTAAIACTQDLVDAFPMANGYPITDARSGYDPSNPYTGRDPRFYSTVFYNGAQVLRPSNGRLMYTFDTTVGGKDASGGVETSPTNYYIKKYIYLEWNKDDDAVQKMPHCIFMYRWAQMCLTFAEAANHALGADDSSLGYSARQALAYLRSRPTPHNMAGLGTSGDPYLDECAAGGEAAFDALVRNEWRLETCFEGQRYWHLRRWATDLSTLNVPVHKVEISRRGASYAYDFSQVVETKAFRSQWQPLPYKEVRRASGLVQNAGWEDWK